MRIQLGQTVSDSITGFRGVVTGFVTYLTGCNQALVQPPTKEDGDFRDSRWIDDSRLVIENVEPIILPGAAVTDARAPGGDIPAPIR